MFARLVFQPPTSVGYAQTYINTVLSVITGAITSNTQLDPAAFNRSASIINTTTPSGWYLVDASANLVGNTVSTGVHPPTVIASNLTDDPTRAKTLWINSGISSNTFVDFLAVPMEGWNSATKTVGNSYFITQFLTQTGNTQSAILNGSNAYARAYSLATHYNYATSSLTGVGGFITIISSSNAHLLVANYIGSRPPTFNNYFFVTEYSRDDPWNTPANGYPSWLWEGACVAPSPSTGAFLGGAFANNTSPGYGSYVFHQHFGALCRIYNTSAATDQSWVPMYDHASVNSGNSGTPVERISSGFGFGQWGITTRYMNWSNFWGAAVAQGTAPDINAGGRTADSATLGYPAPVSRGLAQVGNKYNFTGNYNIQRDINKNPAFSVAELRVSPWNYSTSSPGINGNTIFNGGSITAVNQYLYAFKAGYNSLDEISFGGNTYINLILNQAPSGNVMSSNILVLER